MSSTALKIGALITVVLALFLAVLGFRVAHQYAEQAEQASVAQQVTPVEQKLAVVAVTPLAAYKPIPAESVALVPVHTLPLNYFATVEEVIGRSPLIDIDTGAPVTPRYFTEGNVLARQIPDDHQAVSVEVDDVIAVGGFLRPGDVVDVLVYVRGGAQLGEPQARVLMQALRVLAFDERLVDRPQGLKSEDGASTNRKRRERTVVLSVPEADTTRLMLGSNIGKIALAMHAQKRESGVGEAGVAGLPLSTEAVAARSAEVVPDVAITAAELLKIKPPPAAVKKKPPPKPKVEVYRGSEMQEVRP